MCYSKIVQDQTSKNTRTKKICYRRNCFYQTTIRFGAIYPKRRTDNRVFMVKEQHLDTPEEEELHGKRVLESGLVSITPQPVGSVS